tara:strand:- start:567 stop:674 length:108 start_codon:yes stop_codon:yes gene_type:complete
VVLQLVLLGVVVKEQVQFFLQLQPQEAVLVEEVFQ